MRTLWRSSNKIYELVENELGHIRLDNDKELFSDHPILYAHNLRVAYEYPYRWPKYVKTAVYRVMIDRYIQGEK